MVDIVGRFSLDLQLFSGERFLHVHVHVGRFVSDK